MICLLVLYWNSNGTVRFTSKYRYRLFRDRITIELRRVAVVSWNMLAIVVAVAAPVGIGGVIMFHKLLSSCWSSSSGGGRGHEFAPLLRVPLLCTLSALSSRCASVEGNAVGQSVAWFWCCPSWTARTVRVDILDCAVAAFTTQMKSASEVYYHVIYIYTVTVDSHYVVRGKATTTWTTTSAAAAAILHHPLILLYTATASPRQQLRHACSRPLWPVSPTSGVWAPLALRCAPSISLTALCTARLQPRHNIIQKY